MYSTYPGGNKKWAPLIKSTNLRAPERMATLLSDEGGIAYAAARLRQLADVRKGTTTSHINDLSRTDMLIIYTAYRCGIIYCYGNEENYRNAVVPAKEASPRDFEKFLYFYRDYQPVYPPQPMEDLYKAFIP